jgi:hypothetical protein
MSRLETHKKDLYEVRFSTMCKPACEVANLTQLESHTTRARALMLWRIVTGNLSWGPREVEILYQSTLDSISEAFDIFHYPISRIMLDARADVWAAGLAPVHIKKIIDTEKEISFPAPSSFHQDSLLMVAGELAQLEDQRYLTTLKSIIQTSGHDIQIVEARCGALPFSLGARDVALKQADRIYKIINKCQPKTIVVDSPETAWALKKILPELGLSFPEEIKIKFLGELLIDNLDFSRRKDKRVFVHDSRAAYYLSDSLPNHHAILPEKIEDEENYGTGAVYDLPRKLVDRFGAERVFGPWTRGLAKSCGGDDGLWLTFPVLAGGLARQKLDYAHQLNADTIVTDSPLCASILKKARNQGDPDVFWLPEFLM